MREARMTRWLILASVLFAAPALADETPVALKPGPGLDEVQTSCGICHTLNYIRMNSPFPTPEVWKAEVAKMRTAYGAPIDDETAATIVTYLSKEYATAPARK
jgi:mono/diheme cytochrome c family protein